MQTTRTICVIGLGYVGLPLAVLFSRKYRVIGYDRNETRVKKLLAGHDDTLELEDDTLLQALNGGLHLTSSINEIKSCDFYVVAVPTPVDTDNRPDLSPLIKVSTVLGSVLSKGDVIIYESTVYPGVTEEVCIPILEKESGLKYNLDFFAGYSPERINPGDKVHTVATIRKITSGSTPEIAQLVDDVYNSVLENGTYKAASIRVAEAAKVIENVQRDVNIALINELAKIFNAMGIDTNSVIEAASTKWNFIKMKPGLVGGHCISVDPYYLIEKAQVYGVYPRIMTEARRINDGMGSYVVGQVLRLMNMCGVCIKDAEILICGFAFKENTPDIRNTKVVDICAALKPYTDKITIYDPWVDAGYVQKSYGLSVDCLEDVSWKERFKAVILAVAHTEFLCMDLRSFLQPDGILYDVKGVLDMKVIDGRL